jgi:hypothetical protein
MAIGFPVKANYVTGEVLTATNMNDLSGSVNLLTSAQYAAGKNKIINGDFRFNQRNFSSTTSTLTYGFDRWLYDYSGGTVTYSAQTFTAGTAPVAGYEAINFARLVSASQSGNGDYAGLSQRIEDVRTFANQTITVSFWAKASTGTPQVGIDIAQVFGSGGSATVLSSAVTTKISTISSSWVRYSLSFTIPSISGKTIGTSSYLQLFLWTSVGTTISGAGYAAVGLQNVTIDFWGVQLEAGSTASSFQTATGTIQGELAACQRYYWNISGDNQYVGVGYNQSTTEMNVGTVNPVGMRTNPTLTVATGTNYYGFKRNGADDNFNSLSSTASFASVTGQMLFNSTEISGTAGQAGTVRTNNASAKIEFSAEL